MHSIIRVQQQSFEHYQWPSPSELRPDSIGFRVIKPSYGDAPDHHQASVAPLLVLMHPAVQRCSMMTDLLSSINHEPHLNVPEVTAMDFCHQWIGTSRGYTHLTSTGGALSRLRMLTNGRDVTPPDNLSRCRSMQYADYTARQGGRRMQRQQACWQPASDAQARLPGQLQLQPAQVHQRMFLPCTDCCSLAAPHPQPSAHMRLTHACRVACRDQQARANHHGHTMHQWL